ncbi:protein of unknown function (plasmid) [Cupriavidus taiwanensis]|nr:protein of unknown function [Cupriavidus taiwanensis]
MTSLPIVAHATPGDIIAWAHGRPVTVRQLLADAACLAAALPAGGHVFNACTDRYRFTVGLCAALLAGKPTLLPPSHTPETVRQLLAFAPDTFCLHDQPDAAFDMPALHYHEGLAATAPTAADGPVEIPRIPAAQVMAYVFTSGSTGTPVPHRKTWGAMAGSARAAAQRLGLLDGRAWTLAGTVPPQHMFGLEATVMLVLQGRAALVAAPAFYPADVSAALAAVPAPRALVSSPVHLRMLAQSGLAMPAADLVLCATAPLGRQLAAETEALFAAPLCEIYGSTETGQLATAAPPAKTRGRWCQGYGCKPGPMPPATIPRPGPRAAISSSRCRWATPSRSSTSSAFCSMGARPTCSTLPASGLRWAT